MLVNVPKQLSQMALLHFKECAPVPNYSEINAYKVKIMAWIMTFYHLTFMCDLDLQPTQINVSNGTTTPQGERLYKIILKSMHKCGSYGPDNLIYMYVTFKCDIDLQPTYM